VAQVPVVEIVSKLEGELLTMFGSAEPILDITLGYTRRNLGDDRMAYIDRSQADPLPRNAMQGLSIKAGFVRQGPIAPWEVVSFTAAREADDILVQRLPPDTVMVDSVNYYLVNRPAQYVDGAGALQF